MAPWYSSGRLTSPDHYAEDMELNRPLTDEERDTLLLLEPSDTMRASVVRFGGEIRRVGPFEAYLHPDTEALGFWYAQPIYPIPADGVAEAARDLASLFRSLGATAKVELNAPLFPQLDQTLQSAGYRCTEREPLLVLRPQWFEPRVKPE